MIRLFVWAWIAVGIVSVSESAEAAAMAFDEHPHSTPLSNEYASLGVVFSTIDPIGQGASPDPADHLQPGEAVAPFVLAITAVPSTSTASAPNKVIGAKYDAGGGLIPCDRCGIRILFLDPFPTSVSLWVSDPDAGQTVQFFGVHDLIETVTLLAVHSSVPELVSAADASGISEIRLVSAPSVGVGFDSLSFYIAVPEPSAACLLLAGLVAMRRRMRRSVSEEGLLYD